MKDHATSRVSRRSFVQLVAGAGLGVGLAGSGLAQDPPRDADGKIVPGFKMDDLGAVDPEGATEKLVGKSACLGGLEAEDVVARHHRRRDKFAGSHVEVVG